MSTPEEVQQALDKVKSDFKSYQEEFYKLQGICDAFESTAKRTNALVVLYEDILRKIIEYSSRDDLASIKRLVGGIDIKL